LSALATPRRATRCARAPTWLAALLVAALAACREAPPPSAAPPTPPTAAAAPSAPAAPASAPGFDAVVRGALQPGGPLLRLTLHAAAAPGDSGVLQVRAISVQREGEAQPLQRIDGLDTQTPVVDGQPLVELLDMDFDGLADLRLVAERPAGPNTPYLHWLWNATSQRFTANAALDTLTAPRFDAAKRQVVATWRDGPARYGEDTHVWRDGQLQPLQRSERVYSAPGRYVRKLYRWSGTDWQLQSQQPGRDG
jgi:hypothetical protein